MKKGVLLNSEISHLVSTLGHTDELTVCDAGLPVPEGVKRIDLALTQGIPGFIDTARTILAETQVESVVMAQEFMLVSPDLHAALVELLDQEKNYSGKEITREYLSHDAFKQRTQQSRAIVRTGECTPYANVIFCSGVVF
ncbi:D-ribose pyranase [Vibrio sp. HA2012]|uniref:D-ribose pyranase n=1 Tax=Vibrio sp. HA2012 TaxID=1971595 RepID=UPI000C2C3DAB|nr:D-ribose pyranase [Vibrio sp. HA2012]PJC87140.1 D-ribose pyranase [Vibrio sp. HA2012]